MVVVVVVAMAVVVLNLSFGLAACDVMSSFWFADVAVVLGCHPAINATSHTCMSTSLFFDTLAHNLVAVCLATANPRVPMLLTAGKFPHMENSHNHNFNILRA